MEPEPVTWRPDDLLLEEEAAAYLRVARATVEGWRHRRRADGSKQGPRWIRIEGGRIRYRYRDLLEYVERQVEAPDRASAGRAAAARQRAAAGPAGPERATA